MEAGARPEEAHLPSIHRVRPGAPFHWLAAGLADVFRAPVPCLDHGIVMARVSLSLSTALLSAWGAFWAAALVFGFILLAPSSPWGPMRPADC